MSNDLIKCITKIADYNLNLAKLYRHFYIVSINKKDLINGKKYIFIASILNKCAYNLYDEIVKVYIKLNLADEKIYYSKKKSLAYNNHKNDLFQNRYISKQIKELYDLINNQKKHHNINIKHVVK